MSVVHRVLDGPAAQLLDLRAASLADAAGAGGPPAAQAEKRVEPPVLPTLRPCSPDLRLEQ